MKYCDSCNYGFLDVKAKNLPHQISVKRQCNRRFEYVSNNQPRFAKLSNLFCTLHWASKLNRKKWPLTCRCLSIFAWFFNELGNKLLDAVQFFANFENHSIPLSIAYDVIIRESLPAQRTRQKRNAQLFIIFGQCNSHIVSNGVQWMPNTTHLYKSTTGLSTVLPSRSTRYEKLLLGNRRPMVIASSPNMRSPSRKAIAAGVFLCDSRFSAISIGTPGETTPTYGTENGTIGTIN